MSLRIIFTMLLLCFLKIGNNFIKGKCAAHIGMGGVKIKKEPRQRDEYVYRIS
jgi:hypothetical protein